MTDQAAPATLDLLVFSDDATVRQQVKNGVGRRPAKGMPLVSWTEAATAEGVRLAIKDRQKAGQAPFAALVLDAETKKLGGMGLAHELFTELEQRPPVVLLTARPRTTGWPPGPRRKSWCHGRWTRSACRRASPRRCGHGAARSPRQADSGPTPPCPMAPGLGLSAEHFIKPRRQ